LVFAGTYYLKQILWNASTIPCARGWLILLASFLSFSKSDAF
jgi:hypothetical protein